MSMTCPPENWVAIVSKRGDPHALMAASALAKMGCVNHVIWSDQLADAGSFSWELGCGWLAVADSNGADLRLEGRGTIWWRRGARQSNADHRSKAGILTSRNSAAALAGGMLCLPHVRVVDDPFLVSRAENKLIQLQAASEAGLRMPATLVSSNPSEIAGFAARLGGGIVAKTLRHLPKMALESVVIGTEELADADALRNSPTIYQEIIAGEEHARALVFGDTVHAVRLTSPHFDWRGRKELDVEGIKLPHFVEQQLIALLQKLGLSMAVADFKFAGNEPVFLEINPQGQFLFMQLLAGQNWLDDFAAFLACRKSGL